MVKKTTITYSVLWGNRGVKAGFRKPSTARAFAQIKANKLNERVDIDKITSYHYKTKGEMDWSQKHYVSIFPKKN